VHRRGRRHSGGAAGRQLRRLGTLVLAAAFLAAVPSSASAVDCLSANPPLVRSPAQALRFGITPQLAGTTGSTQGEAVPEDPAKTVAALHSLKPNGKQVVLRLNRLFWSDGQAGIDRFAKQVDDYAAEGFQTEIQVRYHPPAGHEGDIAGWERFVRAAVRELARRRSVVAMLITNEANLPISPNTSDGAYAGVMDALVRGVIVARQEAVALGRRDLPLGFTVMWRWRPDSDQQFWEELGRKADEPANRAFRSSLTYVGLQAYPGLVWPPAPLPGRTAGRETVEALTLLRNCYMPKARLGQGFALWVTENGYATNLGRTEAGQVSDLTSTVDDVHTWSGTLGVTDYRYFNLRDNRSSGTDIFDAVGLLRDDYSEKPSFATYRSLVEQDGEPSP
jgi:hypothetical protein